MSHRPLAVAVATVTGNVGLAIATLVCGLLAMAVGWIPRVGPRLWFGVSRLWSRSTLLAAGIRITARSAERLDPGRRYIFMSNHQSLYDIPALLATLPFGARFLAKSSLFRVPVLGWAMKAGGFITIDREDRSRVREAFSAALARLATGASVLVFPEGTRSLDGRLHAFQRGGFLLALRSGLDIVPVGVRGTGEVRRKGSLRIRPGRVEVRYGRPIEVAGVPVSDKQLLIERVRREIAELAGLETA